MSNYATKSDLKNVTDVNTSPFIKIDDLANLKLKIDKLDIGKLRTAKTDLIKPSNTVKNEVVKKTEYHELVNKVNAIDTSKLVKKIDYNTKIKDIKDKILDIPKLGY